jgi:PqqD family protein of HPr-rel-A system
MTHGAWRLADLAISDSGFVFNPRTGDVFTVNETGRVILLFLKDGLGSGAIAESLRARFEVLDEDVARDVDEFLSVVREHGMCAENGEEP